MDKDDFNFSKCGGGSALVLQMIYLQLYKHLNRFPSNDNIYTKPNDNNVVVINNKYYYYR